MVKLISSQKWQGEGRAFGTDSNPIVKLIVCLSTDGTLPSVYSDVEKLDKCAFAPGSLCLNVSNKKTYIYNGTNFVEWG